MKEPTMEKMRAIVLSKPGPVENLVLEERPVPQVQPGWVRIRVRAFGVNESEVTTRKGLSSPDVTLPRIPGIECVGEVDEATAGSDLRPGQKVATMMGGMGRSFDGSYAQYVVAPVGQIIPFETDLPWDVVGALPEMFQTAFGSLTTGLDLKAGQTLLIRGGTSTVGLSAASIAKEMGATVITTTRSADRIEMLRELGVDHAIVDNGSIADAVRQIVPGGVDAALELVGCGALPDTLSAVRLHGTTCFTGALGDQWTIPEFDPFSIPFGVRLTSYGGEATDLPAHVFNRQLKAIAENRLKVSVAKVYHGLESVRDAQSDLENGKTPGKHVVVVD
ncbi:zinc-binding dehydrogenase [Methylopila turkensis]|uniref:NADPH:quinone reductase n=1 Tax=Methylopila turkensis TaxID=1437816 RepID=A0A9W6JMU2_9HYPH|nr:zinc-binding dehydrogenase [Methylopila turkensis]GLK79064.1 NADPH:quinone reductase [Methylopila turkensis]